MDEVDIVVVKIGVCGMSPTEKKAYIKYIKKQFEKRFIGAIYLTIPSACGVNIETHRVLADIIN
jgi:hypothetical protein